MDLLELNDGWTQIPPKKDGVYWAMFSAPWDWDEVKHMAPELVTIKGGKAIAYMELPIGTTAPCWETPEKKDPVNPVWDATSDDEAMAAWRPQLDGEDFDHPPPQITGTVFERRAESCQKCGQDGAIYHVNAEGAAGYKPKPSPLVCYSCGHVEMVDSYFKYSGVE